MKKLALVALAFAFVGCTEFQSQLTVVQPFEAKQTAFFGKPRKLTIPAGRYETSLSGTMGGDLEIALKVNGKKEKIRMNIPRNTIPENNGTFQLTAEQLKQTFAIRGDLRTDVTRGDLRRAVENCTYTRERRVCGRDEDGQRRCHNETETIHGRQEIEYHPVTTVKVIQVEIVNPSFPSQAAATLNGNNVVNSRDYTYRGICY
jgi:hypothetical protein